MRQISNPPNPFESQHRDLLEPAGAAKLTLYADESREILSRNDSPDLPFRWSVNPYRGCFHGCAYCYARPSHEYWEFGAGTDFESKIVVKKDAPQLLRRAFDKPSWQGELIVFSGNTDCYQPLEAEYGLTRTCLEVCADYRNPVGIITKGALILRDLDVLVRLHREASILAYFSIPFSSDDVARKVEPHAPSITKRFSAMKAISEAGIPTGISIAPVIPGLNEDDIPELLERAHGAGARTATYSLLRLSGSLEPVFLERMREAFPERIGKIINRLCEVRGGVLTESRFFKRQAGQGPYWKMVEQLFALAKRRTGFPEDDMSAVPQTFRRPGFGDRVSNRSRCFEASGEDMKHNPGFLQLVEQAKRRVKECGVAAVKARLDRGERFHFLDIREDHEFAKDHARGARHLGKGIIERDIESVVPDKQDAVVLYCGGGYRSALAADALQQMGYGNVISMDGGIRAWREAGYPLE